MKEKAPKRPTADIISKYEEQIKREKPKKTDDIKDIIDELIGMGVIQRTARPQYLNHFKKLSNQNS